MPSLSLDVGQKQQLEAWEDEGGSTAAAAGDPMKILIVDNDMSAADALEVMAHELGYPQTRVAYSGREALLIAGRFQPHVVLLEVNLLDISGYDVARLLYETSHDRDLRLIAPTASREHAGRELARAAGFERYLLKPVVAEDLAALLQMSRADRTAISKPSLEAPARNKRAVTNRRRSG